MACPGEADLSEFVARALPARDAARLEAHIADCDECRNLVFALASSTVDRGGDAAPVERIGRFEVLAPIGRGAMGVVYRARDPELDRQVAIKVRMSQTRLDVEGEQRLRREAQALAKLAHPNVVAVYETGRHGAMPYVAMELVEGSSLDVWLASGHPASEILALMLGAGRGLAAAHAAGLVHRDFKPHNVFVSAAERIAKVGDFGLVRADETSAAVSPASELSMTLSVFGSIVGTPAYMSPEQLRGEPATEASDQFSFCVTLYEALYGARPFVGKTVDEIATAMRAPVTIPGRPKVPAAVRRALVRGLSADAATRFPSMTALLDELAARPARMRWIAAGVIGAAGLSLAAVTLVGRGPVDDGCARPDPEAARVFAATRFAALGPAFAATGAGEAQATARRVSDAFAAYGARWQTASVTSCKATAQHRQSEKLGDLQRACLERKLRAADELANVLAAVKTPEAISRATGAVLSLGEVDSCTRADPAVVGDRDPPPADRAADVKALEAQLDSIAALVSTGQPLAAGEKIDAVVARARALAYPPVLARALIMQSGVYTANSKFEQNEKILDEAAREAAKARDDRAAAEAWTRRVYAVGVQFGRYDDAHQWAQAADAAVLRAGDPPDLRAGLHMNVGTLLIEQGKLDEARGELEAALALRTRYLPDGKIQIGDVHNNLAALLQRQGKMDEAQQEFERALALYREANGDEHPDVFEVTVNLGFLFTERDMMDKALEYLTRARALGEKVLGPDHVNVGIAIDTMGLANVGLGKYEEAIALHRRAYEIMLKQVGPKHPRTGYAMANLARAQQRLGDYPAAIESHRQALQILADSVGPTHDLVARIGVGLATVYMLTGDRAAARTEIAKSLAIYEKNGHGEAEEASFARIDLAQMSLQENKVAEARRELTTAYERLRASSGAASFGTLTAQAGLVYCDAVEREVDRAKLAALEAAMTTANAQSFEPHILAFLEYSRARAYAALGDIARAKELATAAIAGYDRAKIPESSARVERWRASLR